MIPSDIKGNTKYLKEIFVKNTQKIIYTHLTNEY